MQTSLPNQCLHLALMRCSALGDGVRTVALCARHSTEGTHLTA